MPTDEPDDVLRLIGMLRDIRTERGGKALLALADSLATTDADPRTIAMLRAIAVTPGEPARPAAASTDGPLEMADIELAEWCADAKWKHHCADVVVTLFSMPRSTRHAISALVCKLAGTDLVPGQQRTQAELDALHEQLRELVCGAGGTMRIADALSMSAVVRAAAPADPQHASLVKNVVSVVEEWSAHREKTRESVNGFAESMLGYVDWDHIAPSALVAAFRAIVGGLPLADAQDLSDHADHERDLVRTCTESDAQPGELSRSDAWLLVKVTEACQRTGSFDFIDEVADLPHGARRVAAEILADLDQVIEPPSPQHREHLMSRLASAIIGGGGTQELVDAFLLDPLEWRRRHVIPAHPAHLLPEDVRS